MSSKRCSCRQLHSSDEFHLADLQGCSVITCRDRLAYCAIQPSFIYNTGRGSIACTIVVINCPCSMLQEEEKQQKVRQRISNTVNLYHMQTNPRLTVATKRDSSAYKILLANEYTCQYVVIYQTTCCKVFGLSRVVSLYSLSARRRLPCRPSKWRRIPNRSLFLLQGQREPQ
jgi:hypothetical protein